MDGFEHFRFFGTDGIRVEGCGRLHGGHCDKLEQMIGDHVTQRTGRFVELAALLDPDRFRNRDLHMLNSVAVPDRLEKTVRKPQGQNVLHGFFPEKMIDAVDLIFP